VTAEYPDKGAQVAEKIRQAFAPKYPHKPSGSGGKITFNVPNHLIMHSISGGKLYGMTAISYDEVTVLDNTQPLTAKVTIL